MNTKNIVPKVKVVLKRMVKEGLNIHRLDPSDFYNISQELETENIIDFSISEITENNADCFMMVTYYSEKLYKTVIFDYDFDWNEDGESIELMAESIANLQRHICNFEDGITCKH